MISEGLISSSSRVVFVNDGSSDSTWQLIRELASSCSIYEGISLSRNRGHQNALLAGLMDSKDKCDITISIDADGQDDIFVMEDMVKAYRDGCEVVYGVRSSRETDSFFKRSTAQLFYRILEKMGVETVFNHADYRLLSSRVLDELSRYKEVNLFLRGMVPLVGFKSTSVEYERHERIAGGSHYPLSKMLSLAADGITSLSIKPIHMITVMGFVVAVLGLLGVAWIFISWLSGSAVAGWASLAMIVCLFGGMQMLSIGVIGEYVGKTYMESKHRPRWAIGDRTGEDK